MSTELENEKKEIEYTCTQNLDRKIFIFLRFLVLSLFRFFFLFKCAARGLTSFMQLQSLSLLTYIFSILIKLLYLTCMIIWIHIMSIVNSPVRVRPITNPYKHKIHQYFPIFFGIMKFSWDALCFFLKNEEPWMVSF